MTRPTLTPRVVRGLRFALYLMRDERSRMSPVYPDAIEEADAAQEYLRALLREWDENKAKLAREGTKLPEGE